MSGDRAAGRDLKPATLERGGGARPLFIKEGETVRVNTQTGEVSGRAEPEVTVINSEN